MRVLTGVLDRVWPLEVSGWALLPQSSEPADVCIKVNGQEVAVVKADQLRRDVRSAGRHPTGQCGFILRLAPEQGIVAGDLVSARVVGVDYDLVNSPMPCQEASRAASMLPPPKTEAGPSAVADHELPSLPLPPPVRGRKSSRIFLESVLAFLLREIKQRYGQFRFSYIWPFVQPIAYIVVLRSARRMVKGGVADDIYGVDITYFLALGLIPFFMFQHSYHQCMGAISGFKGLFSYRQVRPIDVIVARILIEFLIMTVVMALLMSGFYWFDTKISVEDPLAFAGVVGCLFVMSMGVGLLMDVYITSNPELRQWFTLVEKPLFFISGVMFTMDAIPKSVLFWLQWNPLLHALDLARGAMLTKYDSPGSWSYLISCSILFLLFGLAAYRKDLHRLTQQ